MCTYVDMQHASFTCSMHMRHGHEHGHAACPWPHVHAACCMRWEITSIVLKSEMTVHNNSTSSNAATNAVIVHAAGLEAGYHTCTCI
jgi:hypothetical protein